MPKRVEPDKKILQKSIGFNFRQHRFFNEHPEFKPDVFCREAVDEQIKLIDDSFLE